MALVNFLNLGHKPSSSNTKEPWKVLIADDEKPVHIVTELVLRGFTFEGRPLKLLSAFSAKETLEILTREKDIAVVILDVVMENWNAGLDAVLAIRNNLNIHDTRIIIRTGQSGAATVGEVVREYDINDFRDKSKLDQGTLINAIIFALRSYRDIKRVSE
jgi:CheY-like chemotaxis protein